MWFGGNVSGIITGNVIVIIAKKNYNVNKQYPGNIFFHGGTLKNSRFECTPKELNVFRRVSLQPEEMRFLRVEIPIEVLAYCSPSIGWTVKQPNICSELAIIHRISSLFNKTTLSLLSSIILATNLQE
jgi:hypothetical protein